MNKLTFPFFIFFVLVYVLNIQSQTLSDSTLSHTRLYTSLKDALLEPENVYRLKLKKCKRCDSLPNELFQLTNLRELTVSRLKLKQLNESIGTFTQLQYLNISQNKLTSLPPSIGNLTHLENLIINRNKIKTLPSTISNLHQLKYIDAWDNPLYTLPPSIRELENSLELIDLRQIPLKESELLQMETLLPKTTIKYTYICDCENGR